MASTVGGNIIASFLLSKVSLTNYYMIMTSFGLTSVFLFSFLKEPKQSEEEDDEFFAEKKTLSIKEGISQTF